MREFIFLIVLLIPAAYAYEYEEELIDFDEKITEQHKKINNLQENITSAKAELKEAKSDNTWTGKLAAIEIEEKISSLQKQYADARNELKELLQAKSDHIKLLKEEDKNKIKPKKFNSTGLVKIINVNLSNNCLVMIKNDIPTPCPTYKNIITLDSSDTSLSGKFTTDDGFFHRGPAVIAKSWKFYTDDVLRIFVDPPKGQSDVTKTITIENNFDSYFMPGDRTVDEKYEIVEGEKLVKYGNQTKAIPYIFQNQTELFGTVIYHDMYIDPRCHKATINAEYYKTLLPKAIYIMRDNCENYEPQREVIPQVRTEHDITTSQKYKDEKRLEWIKQNCLQTYGICNP